MRKALLTHGLAWCYGDMGLCWSLFNGASCTGDVNMMRGILQMLYVPDNASEPVRKPYLGCAVLSRGCRVSYFFNKFYQTTGEAIFAETARYWYETTIGMDNFQDGLAGYKTFNRLTTPAYEDRHGLLERITGTGLSLLSAVSDV